MSAQHPDEDEAVDYPTREEYLAEDVVQNYIPNRFTGLLGRYRFWREQRAVNSLIARVPRIEIQAILDCPTGIGRWLPNLAVLQPQRIVAVDVSPTMLRRAETVSIDNVSTEFRIGVAEHVPFEDGTFDLVFCHALLKHLPESAQLQVIKELARVTSRYVIVTASVRRGLAGFTRRFRRPRGAVAVSKSWFEQAASEYGLRVVCSRKASTPLGAEYSYLLLRQ